jgi:hypothetical protein
MPEGSPSPRTKPRIRAPVKTGPAQPLLAAPSPTSGDLVGYAIYGLVVVVVSLRSNMAHVNPTLYLLGWRVTGVTLDGGEHQYLVSRNAPAPGDQIRVTRLYGVLHAK